jgi:hypothetical protein
VGYAEQRRLPATGRRDAEIHRPGDFVKHQLRSVALPEQQSADL